MREIAVRGRAGEEFARRLLEGKRYKILETNYRVRGGELDIIAEDPSGTTVFVEVRSLKADAAVDPAETIDRRKLSRLLRAGTIYLTVSGRLTKPFRFDFIGIRGEGQGAVADHRMSIVRQEEIENGHF